MLTYELILCMPIIALCSRSKSNNGCFYCFDLLDNIFFFSQISILYWNGKQYPPKKHAVSVFWGVGIVIITATTSTARAFFFFFEFLRFCFCFFSDTNIFYAEEKISLKNISELVGSEQPSLLQNIKDKCSFQLKWHYHIHMELLCHIWPNVPYVNNNNEHNNNENLEPAFIIINNIN